MRAEGHTSPEDSEVREQCGLPCASIHGNCSQWQPGLILGQEIREKEERRQYHLGKEGLRQTSHGFGGKKQQRV